MRMVFLSHFKRLNLKEHQKLELVIKKIIEDAPPSTQESPLRLIGLFESDIDDLADQHDEYLYHQSEET